MSKRREIREALVARIETVTTANGYAVTVQKVSTGSVRIPEGIENTPHVTVLYPDEEFSIQALQRVRGVAHFVLGIACLRESGGDPEDVLDDAFAAVCKAVTKFENAMFLDLPWVHYVFIAGEESEQLPHEMAADIAALNVFVDVHYAFESGNF